MLAGREFRDRQTVVSEILRSLKPKTTTYRHRELAFHPASDIQQVQVIT